MPQYEDSGSRFEQLVRQLLRASGFQIESMSGDLGLDFLAVRQNESWAVQIKYYRTERAQVSLLETAAGHLLMAARRIDVRKSMLVLSARLPPSHRATLEERYGLTFCDRADLLAMAAEAPELSDELAALLELTEAAPTEMEGRSAATFLAKARREVERSVRALPVDTRGTDLCEELRALPRGRRGWQKYENLCDRILRYLFSSSLHGWRSQQWTADDLNRFDYICRIRPVSEFWRFLVDNLNSRYLLFEFKNYTGPVSQGQILTTEKYLLEKGLRRVAIILSRAGASPSAIVMTQGAMREQGKLIIVLDDDQVCRMLHMRERGEDPTDLLFDAVDSFLLSLPR